MGDHRARRQIEPGQLYEVAQLFHAGHDTKAIAERIKVRECTIANALPAALALHRRRKASGDDI